MPSVERTIVIIGGDAAGMSAAAKAKRTNPECEVFVFEKGPFVSYAACGLPYLLSGAVRSHHDLLSRTVEQFEQQGVKVQTEAEVVELSPGTRSVTVKDLRGGGSYQQSFDACITATGASTIRPSLPGAGALGVFTLRSLRDALTLREHLERYRPRHATLVGGGYVSMEMAEALRQLRLEITLVEAQGQVMPSLDPPMAALVQRELARHGVRVVLDSPVRRLEVGGNGLVTGVETATEGWRTDLVLFGVGVRPNVALAEACHLPLDATGGIRTNQRMETDRPGLFAAGDCTSATHLLTGKRAYLPLGTTANKQGRVAGENAAGGSARFEGVVGSAVTKVFGLEVARTGLTERDAEELSGSVATAQITESSRARYYPGGSPLAVRLLANRATGKLIGGQVIGDEGAAKRLDVIATALHAEMTADQFARLDLCYAPPFSPVWDPLLIAASELQKDL